MKTLLALALLALPLQAADVTLAFDPSEPCPLPDNCDPIGYRIYYGSDQANLTNKVEVGMSLTNTIGNLAYSSTNFFVVKAWNSSGESEPSNLVTYIVPPQPVPNKPRSFRVVVNGVLNVTVDWEPFIEAIAEKVEFTSTQTVKGQR